MKIFKYYRAPVGADAEVSLWRSLCGYATALFLVIIVLPLSHQGMFFDGVIYATLAKNLHLGYSTLWRPVFSETILNPFYEHPPLAIYFQSLFFKLFGSEFGPEQAYAITMALGQFGLIAWYWLHKNKTHRLYLGLLLLLWIITPLNWQYIKNYLIATLTLFTTLASLVLMVRVETKKGLFLQYWVSSVCIVIAFFCDGPVAFFPLVIPILRQIIYKPTSIHVGCMETVLLGLMLAVCFYTFFKIFPEAVYNIQQFLHQQVFASVQGTRSSVSLNTVGMRHLLIVILILKAYTPISLFALSCILLSAKIAQQSLWTTLVHHLKNKHFLFLLSIALVASLPIGLSCRQGMRYILPSAPFAILAMMELSFRPFAALLAHGVRQSSFKLHYAAWHVVFALSVVCIGTVNLVKYHQSDIAKIIQDVRHIDVYCANEALCRRHHIFSADNAKVLYDISFYLARYSHTQMSVALEAGFPYHIGFKNDPIPVGYHTVELPLSIFRLTVVNTRHARFKTSVPNPIQAL